MLRILRGVALRFVYHLSPHREKPTMKHITRLQSLWSRLCEHGHFRAAGAIWDIIDYVVERDDL